MIAIVDDDPSILNALELLLSSRSLEAKTFQSGWQFLASLENELPSCVILDLQMPGMTGLEVQQDLARRGLNIPTIIVTAHDGAEMRARCESAGAIAYLSKPVRDDLLFAAIDGVTQAAGRG
jgi:FixJ family two-component response regulator